MDRRTSARIAAVLLGIHGLIEVSALISLEKMSNSLISFGGMGKFQIEANIFPIALLGILWGLTRFAAAAGIWPLKKWGLALGIAMCLITLTAAISVIPAGVVDTCLSALALTFLLHAWFGSQKLEL
jgi:hypothetical protein